MSHLLEVKNQNSEVRGQGTEFGGQGTEVKGQRTWVNRQQSASASRQISAGFRPDILRRRQFVRRVIARNDAAATNRKIDRRLMVNNA